MKKSYPEYRTTGTKHIEEGLKGKQKKIYEDYMAFLKSKGSGQLRTYKIYRPNFLQFIDIVEKPLDKLKPNDLIAFWGIVNDSNREVATKNLIKHSVKRFVKWYYRKDLDMRDCLENDLKLKHQIVNKKKINKQSLLTDDDIKELLEACQTPSEKAQFYTMYETGCRPHELRLAKWKDIDFDNKTIHLFSTKTQEARDIPIKESLIALKNWKGYSYENDDDYIFHCRRLTKEEKERGLRIKQKPVDRWTFGYVITKIKERTGINKPVYSYLIRHTRLTELKTKYHVEGMDRRKFAGHKEGSKMDAVYVTMDDRDMQQSILSKVYNFEELSEEKKHELELKIEAQEKLINQFRKTLNNLVKIVEKGKKSVMKQL